jgi:hypothetical protein
MTCLGNAGDPPYHCTSALHSLSGTNTMSLPIFADGLSLPPSTVRLVTLPPEVGMMRHVLSISPGLAGGIEDVDAEWVKPLPPPPFVVEPFLEWRGDCPGVELWLEPI